MTRRQRKRMIGLPDRCASTQLYKDMMFRCLLALGHEGDHEGVKMVEDKILEITWIPQGFAVREIAYENEIHEGEENTPA